jgi:pyruvate-formate lyase-activating enzyme
MTVIAKDKSGALPPLPQAVQVEVEFTNACNARCSACPRDHMPSFGMLSEQTLAKILGAYVPNMRSSPEFIVAGGGEPLLHPRAIDLLSLMVRSGFATSLTTNATRISANTADQLVKLGLSCIYVSFWGITAEEYESEMHLPFAPTLANVEHLAAVARGSSTPVLVKWLRTPGMQSTNEEITRFWGDRGVDVVTGYHDVWNRGGLVQLEGSPSTRESLHLPDPSRRIWCTDIYFSDSYSWNGNCVLCCCNFFTNNQIRVGNIWSDAVRTLAERKLSILESRPIPDMCKSCLLPRDTRGLRLARLVLDSLSPEEAAMLTSYGPGST